MKNGSSHARRLRVAMLSTAALGLVLAGRVTPVFAQAVHTFEVPRGDLATVVTRIARTAGTPIAFPAGLASGRMAGPIQGSISVQGALAQALAGTGLQVAPGPAGSLTIRAATGPSAAAAGGDVAAIDVTDEAAANRYGDVGFQAGDVGLGSRIPNAPAKEVPITINTITSKVLQSQAVTTATDAVQNVSGVSIGSSSGGATAFTIRGFTVSDVTVNGLGATGFGNSGFTQIPIDEVERVEVLKGPTSILTGATTRGGGINITTKRPTDRVIQDVSVRYGSYGYKTLAFDFGGPLAGTEGLTYRFNLSGNKADENYAGYRDAREYLIAPSVQWTDGSTTLLAGVRYSEQSRSPIQYTFIPRLGADPNNPIIHIPRGTTQFNPNLHYLDQTMAVFSEQSHDFGDILGMNLVFNNKIRYETSANDINSFAWLGSRAPRDPAGNYNARQVNSKYSFNRLVEQFDLTATYDAGFARQTSKFSVDYKTIDLSQSTNNAPITSINPVLGLPQQALFRPENSIGTAYTTVNGTGLGYQYLEKFDTLDNRLHILGQVRYDDYRYRNGSGITGNDRASVAKPTGISWTAGGAFDVTPYFTAYGNRSAGFLPTYSVNNLTGLTAEPEQQDLYEYGGRFFLLDKKLTLTLSYFDLRATNVSICDAILGCNFVQVVPGQSSKGVEFDIQGEIFPGFNIIGSFSSTKVKYESPLFSLPFAGTPQYTASLWGSYTIQDGPMHGLTLGFGARGNSNSPTNYGGDTSAFNVPGYVTADAMIGYDFDRWSLQFKINNMMNKYYYQPSYSANYIGIGQGRNFLFSAKYSFQ
ncbi:TonB-dependent receptor [Methylobacterium sp. BTF04]|uniref:TonB-dependent siderophore receptor n=1 Tax=Methylobacterium sp. BTF04 TaxID=2708300 RepID=UPI0013D5C7E0|nr:TonB-dependent receptor [Methylobacterium sp. BTF04]NEU12653.1 TonB-dependent receptor [Methylobacterium sp. BTF04]